MPDRIPSPDDLASICRAGGKLLSALGLVANLRRPSFPILAPTLAALEAIAATDAALNPGRLPWGHPALGVLVVAGWPDQAELMTGLGWFRDLFHGIVSRWELTAQIGNPGPVLIRPVMSHPFTVGQGERDDLAEALAMIAAVLTPAPPLATSGPSPADWSEILQIHRPIGGDGSAAGRASSSLDMPGLVARLRASHPRSSTLIALLDYMQGRDSATFQDIATDVHGDPETTENSIRQNVRRLNVFLESVSAPVRFGCGGSHVIKEISRD